MADKKGVFLFESFFRILKQLPSEEAINVLDAFMNSIVHDADVPDDLSPLGASIAQTMIEQDEAGEKKRAAHAARVNDWKKKKENTADNGCQLTSGEVQLTKGECQLTSVGSQLTKVECQLMSIDCYKNKNKNENKNEIEISLSPPPLSQEVGEPAGAQPPAPPERDRAERDANVADGFEVFWALYPRKQRRAQALKQWNRIADTTETADAICQAVIRWSESRQWTQEGNRFVPLPENFLSKRIWMDEPDAPGALGATPGAPGKSGAPDASGTLDRPPNSFDTQEFFDCAVERACGKDGTG